MLCRSVLSDKIAWMVWKFHHNDYYSCDGDYDCYNSSDSAHHYYSYYEWWRKRRFDGVLMNVGRSTEDHSDCCENENDGDLPLLGANSNDSSPDASLHPSNKRRDDRTHTTGIVPTHNQNGVFFSFLIKINAI